MRDVTITLDDLSEKGLEYATNIENERRAGEEGFKPFTSDEYLASVVKAAGHSWYDQAVGTSSDAIKELYEKVSKSVQDQVKLILETAAQP